MARRQRAARVAVDGVKVEFVYADGAKDDVQLSGDWNDWKAIQMFHEGGGMWSVVTPVPPGPHEFKFIVDGEWKHSNRHPTIGIDETSLNNVRFVLPEPDLSAERDGVADPRARPRGQRASATAGGAPAPAAAPPAAAADPKKKGLFK
uniref:AMP-activated protein kinase glycogen-binding domain-containing protein n=1 Tax=Timspurckia oligopyrenoides TaxID=708627 RepID=A0A7S0ZGK0_9RHOD|mmetsp:Transcript_4372/g.7673  ORF Transcript_4372/g.7673 Transcript_4372/m.7673 type:complete len:148 (+) Transcript_4372:256-699(+)|eukprot:CAMPEP_0182441226 /NCGR_PEP_ID=MMETSP1172-20130603/175_1 /TAXON_ID=708627 /ORGANISM="Timspurckia oligopyrenoides, Strain CCMP3278" /LENGTH=147 /DNA_ID=CAMNT_0024635399 /DNA_START=421 /DNA_END=864 /DNA_ORIENTATION=-